MKKYEIIYADPPWSYDDNMTGYSMGASAHYETQDLQWIKNLPVKDMTTKDATLFMWAVSPLLPEAMAVISAWGFKYKTVAFVWSKVTSIGTEIANPGRWTMGNIEVVLLGTKGHPKRISKNVRQLVTAPRLDHSAKPNVVRKRIVDLMGERPRLEMFARGDRSQDLFGYNRFEGWDLYGDQAEGPVVMAPKTEQENA